jgi:fumarylacetoacetate (FAA) hydrolase
MKLATLRDRTRDGRLVVVSRDLTRCVSARPIAATLQQALDDWDYAAPRLGDLGHQLELGSVPSERFHEHDAMSPLPRAFQWLGATTGEDGAQVLTRRGSDRFLAPREPIALPRDLRIGCTCEVAIVTGDVLPGISRGQAVAAVRLLLIVNEIVGPGDDAGQSGSAAWPEHGTAFSPVAVTPDELAASWDDGRIRLSPLVSLNGGAFAAADSSGPIDVAGWIVGAARNRPLAAGTVIGIGAGGATNLLEAGDGIRIEARDAAGHSIFGAIEQAIERA